MNVAQICIPALGFCSLVLLLAPKQQASSKVEGVNTVPTAHSAPYLRVVAGIPENKFAYFIPSTGRCDYKRPFANWGMQGRFVDARYDCL
jgi:hypothetical protein